MCFCVFEAFIANQYSDILVHTQLCQGRMDCSVLGTLHLSCQEFVVICGKVLHLNVANCLSTVYCGLGITVYMFVF